MIRRLAVVMLAPLAGLGVLAAAAAFTPALALINESPSLPEGLYFRAPGARPRTDAIVAVAPPPAARAYLAGLGVSAEAKLLKRVAAAGGAMVCASPGAVDLAGRTLAVRGTDRRGAPLPHWRGCRVLAADELFLVGDTADSFDSRYFGPVRLAGVDGVYREILTW